jgi:hypothetical protein
MVLSVQPGQLEYAGQPERLVRQVPSKSAKLAGQVLPVPLAHRVKLALRAPKAQARPAMPVRPALPVLLAHRVNAD